MAVSFPRTKDHRHVLIPILFFLSFFLILSALLTGQGTLHLFLFPSNSNSSSSHPFKHTSQLPISQNLPKNSQNDITKLPISDNTVKGAKTVENPGFINKSQLRISQNLPTYLQNDSRNLPIKENAEKTVSFSHGLSKVSNFDAKMKENSDENGVYPGFVGGSFEVESGIVEEDMKRRKSCNLYKGKWVKDYEYPVYKPGSCPFVDEAFDCQSNGRPDFGYLKCRWKPDDCDLPRFNATDFLVRLQGKRLMLVGDSMNRNQFESMLCLLREGLTDKSRMYEVHGYKITKGRGFYIFKFVDYNCTVEFVRSHFLVKEGTRINGQGNSNPTLSIDKIDKTAGKWKRADILVFNTGHWWTHGKTSRGKNYFKEGDYVYPQFDAVEAYRRAMKTWAEWIDKNVNTSRQLVFYRAYSSAHFRGGDWDSGGTCNGEKEPILDGAFLDTYPVKMKIVEEAIQKMRVPVLLLNITRLTNFRKDGHPSIYGKVRPSNTKVSGRKQDCSHWCLPGVPDAWNELIYATLVLQQTPQSNTVGS